MFPDQILTDGDRILQRGLGLSRAFDFEVEGAQVAVARCQSNEIPRVARPLLGDLPPQLRVRSYAAAASISRPLIE